MAAGTDGPRRPAVRLSGLIAPAYRALHRDIQRHGHTHYVLTGGRGSGKSSFAALEVWLILLRHPDCHGLVLRKTAASLRHSAVNQYLWAAGRLGVTDAVYRAGENAILRRGTGQMILLRGADDWTKLKSLKMPFGRVAAVHFEERDQFAGRAELDGILRTVMRGGGDFWSFETGNPPPRPGHWANAERAALAARPDYLLHHGDYRALPAAWLGSAFLAEAEQARASNEAAWRRDYLGEVGADSGLVFGNVELRDITEGEIAGFERVYRGVDWGFWPDPFAYVEAAWDPARRTVYLFGEETAFRLCNEDAAALLKARGVGGRDTVWADAAEPKSIAAFRRLGLLCRAAGKGRGSLQYSLRWLAGLRAIVIDPARCPETAREFGNYCYVCDRDGRPTGDAPDRDNHHIDAARYALWSVWARS